MFVCPEPKPPPGDLFPEYWPKLNPVEVEYFPDAEEPNGDAVVVGAAKGTAVGARVSVLVPKRPPEVVEVLDGGWPKVLVLVFPPLTGWPKENFGGSDIVASPSLETET